MVWSDLTLRYCRKACGQQQQGLGCGLVCGLHGESPFVASWFFWVIVLSVEPGTTSHKASAVPFGFRLGRRTAVLKMHDLCSSRRIVRGITEPHTGDDCLVERRRSSLVGSTSQSDKLPAQNMSARLIAVAGPVPKTEFLLGDEEAVIGRDVAATVCINSRSASRRHCTVRRSGDQYLIKDLGSSNGTLVNGLPVTECVLRHGDRIAVSDALFVFADQAAELPLRTDVTESRDDEALEFATVQQAEPLYRNPQRLLASMQSQKQANHVQALLEINRKAATLREPEELEQALLDAAFQLTPAESAAVLLFEQLDAPATSVTGQNRASQLTSNQLTSKIQFSQTVVRRVLNEQVAVLARNTGADEALKDVASLAAGGNQSILCVPLLAHGRSLGVLYLSITKRRAGVRRNAFGNHDRRGRGGGSFTGQCFRLPAHARAGRSAANGA